MKLKKEKCTYLLDSVKYLGQVITKDGLRSADSKVEAVIRAPAPRNVSELHLFLRLVTYYGKFLPSLATVLSLLYSLLQKATCWSWGSSQAKAFDEVMNPFLT